MQPVIIEDTVSIGAATVVENILVSNPSLRGVIRAPFDARGGLALVQSATGVVFSLDYGSKNVVANSNGRVSTSSPDDPLDVVNDNWFCREGDQLTLRCVNTSGGAITVRYRLVLMPMVSQQGESADLPPDTRVMQAGPVSVPAAAVDQQLLDGLRYERSPVDSLLEIFMTQSGLGLTRSLFVDMERIAPPSTISLNNRVPMDPFDKTVEGVEVARDQLIQLQASNPTGGAINVFWKMKLQEMVRT